VSLVATLVSDAQMSVATMVFDVHVLVATLGFLLVDILVLYMIERA
jgi:hypothetical protein